MRNIGRRAQILDLISNTTGNQRARLSRKFAIAMLSVFWLAIARRSASHPRTQKRTVWSELLHGNRGSRERGSAGSASCGRRRHHQRQLRIQQRQITSRKPIPVSSSSLFPEWKDPGTAFYKVRTKVLAPANFKETGDEGTLAVRYVVQSRDANRTTLRIDAVFRRRFPAHRS